MNKIRVHDNDTGETQTLELPLTTESLMRALATIYDRSFECSFKDADGKQIIQMIEKDSGQEVMTLRDVAIVLGKSQKEVYGMIGSRAKQTANVLGVKSLPVFKIPGSKEYGVIRSDFFAWLRSLPAPIRVHKGRKKRLKKQ